MTIHEFGKNHPQAVVLIHPSVVMWDYFERVIPLLQDRYHLIIPALPGYDPETDEDYTSVEQIALELEDWLVRNGQTNLACIYGCSMGGSIAARFLADDRISVRSAALDGAIMPYQLPWLLTRLIAIKDFLMISLGKAGGIKLLEKAFSTDEYSDEDLQYVSDVLKRMSGKTIWRTFESCNNFRMPEQVKTDGIMVEYWYAREEEKARRKDIAWIRQHMTGTVWKVFDGVGHGGLATMQPEVFADEIDRMCWASKA